MPSSNTRLTVLISGNGSNFQALIDACADRSLPNTSIVRCISNRQKAYGRERARIASIPESYHNLVPYGRKYPSENPEKIKFGPQAREAYDSDLADLVIADAPNLVVCAGWMHIVSAVFLDKLQSAHIQIINLHPGLPGGLAGADCIQRAYDAFQAGNMSKTGVMIHYVITDVDLGEAILWEEVQKVEGESLEQLETRMHTVEHRLIVEGTRRAIDKILQEKNTAS